MKKYFITSKWSQKSSSHITWSHSITIKTPKSIYARNKTQIKHQWCRKLHQSSEASVQGTAATQGSTTSFPEAITPGFGLHRNRILLAGLAIHGWIASWWWGWICTWTSWCWWRRICHCSLILTHVWRKLLASSSTHRWELLKKEDIRMTRG